MNLKSRLTPNSNRFDPTPDDLTIVSNGLLLASDERGVLQDKLDHLWFEVTEREAGQTYAGWKVVKLVMLRFLPQDARKDAGLVAKTKAALVGLYNSRVRFDLVQVVAGMFEPVELGVMQCYGVAAFEPTKAAALEQANLGMAALRAVLANYVQSRFEALDVQKAAWLLSALGTMPHALVAIGHPDARLNARGGGRAAPGEEQQLDTAGQGAFTLQQNELLFRGMSALTEEFVFMLIAHKINLGEIARMLAGISGEASVWASRTTGVKGISVGIAVPISLSGGIARGANTAYAENTGRSAATTVGDSQTATHTVGTADTVGQANTHTLSHEVGYSHTDGHTVGLADGVNTGQAHSVGADSSISHTHTDGTNESWGTAHSVANSQSVGTTDSQTSGTNVSQGLAISHSAGSGVSDGVNQSHSAQDSHANQHSDGGGSAQQFGGSHTDSANVGVGLIASGSEGTATTQTAAITNNTSHSDGATDVVGHGTGWGSDHSASTNQSDSVTPSVGIAHINTRTVSVNASSSSSESNTDSHSVGVSSADSVGTSQGKSVSDTASQGQSQVVSSSQSSSDTSSVADGESWGQTNSWSRTQSVSDAVALGQSRGLSVGRTFGDSIGRGLSLGSSLGLSGGVIPSVSAHKSYNWVDAQAQQVAELIRTQEAILVDANKEGAYLTDVYLLTRTPTGQAAAEALVRQAFHGSEKVVTSFQTRRLNLAEQAYIRRHVAAFTPSTRIETIPGLLEGYKDSTLLPPEKLAALYAPGLFERGPAVTTEERIPPFAFMSDLEGDVGLGRLWDSETYLLTKAELRLSEAKHMHTAFCGDTGYGKTVAAERLCVEAVLRWHHRAIVLDWGQGWRKLFNSPIPRSRVQIYQLHERAVRPLRWNPLQISQRIGPNSQAESTVDIFATAAGLGNKQSSFMLQALREVYIAAGVFTSDPEVFAGGRWAQVVNAEEVVVTGAVIGTQLIDLNPDQLQALAVHRSQQVDLSDWIARLKEVIADLGKNDTNRSALEGAVARMERLTHGAIGRRYAKGPGSMAIEDLGLIGPADDQWGVAVLEGGDSMDPLSKSVLLGLIAWHLYEDSKIRRRESSGRRLPTIDIFFEEANKIFSSEPISGGSSSSQGAPAPSVSAQIVPIFTEGRKLFCYGHVIVQAISKLPPEVLSSCVNIFVGQSKGIHDRDAILAHLAKSEKGFTDEEYKRFVSRMPPKMAICKLGYGDTIWKTGAMLCEAKLVPATEPSDDELRDFYGGTKWARPASGVAASAPAAPAI